MSRQFLTPKQLADRWRVPVATVHTMAHRGQLPPRVRISTRTWRVALSDLEHWENERHDSVQTTEVSHG